MLAELGLISTPLEVAHRLKVSRRAVYAWLASGMLAGMKAGQGWRITERALQDFLQLESLNGEGGGRGEVAEVVASERLIGG